jgi:ParB family transcriptional regulator, chromosome partitioning protein
MQVRQVAPSRLDLSLGRLRQLPEATVRSMMASLSSKGQLSPLVAAEQEEALVLVDGFIRQLAAVRLKLPTVQVEVVRLTPVQMKAQLYLRNRDRGLVLLEECRLVRELVEVDGLNQVEVGDLLERHKSWVSRRLGLLRQMSEHLVEEAALGELGPGALRKLAQLPVRNQERLWAAVRQATLGRRETELFLDLWRKAPDPEAQRFLLEHPHEALKLARGVGVPSVDPRLGAAGEQALRSLEVLRRAANRLNQRLREGLGKLSPEGVELLDRARVRATEDSVDALGQLEAWLLGCKGEP